MVHQPQTRNDAVVVELAADIAALYKAISNLSAGTRNRTLANNSVAPTAVTNGSALNYAAILMKVQSSGLFRCSISWSFSGATAATSSNISVSSQVNTVPIALTNATPAGSPNGSVGSTSPACFVSSAAGGISVTGGPFSVLTQSSETFTTASGQTTGTFSWSGLIQNAIAAENVFSPFAFGSFVAILFALNSNTSSWTLSAPSMFAVEEPA